MWVRIPPPVPNTGLAQWRSIGLIILWLRVRIPHPVPFNNTQILKEFMMDENGTQIPDDVELPNPDNSIQSEDVAPIEVIDYG